MRAWCAKEALGKTLGRGLGGNPRSLVVREIEPRSGRIMVTPANGTDVAAPAGDPRLAPVRTALDDEVAVAISLCQREDA